MGNVQFNSEADDDEADESKWLFVSYASILNDSFVDNLDLSPLPLPKTFTPCDEISADDPISHEVQGSDNATMIYLAQFYAAFNSKVAMPKTALEIEVSYSLFLG